MNERIKELEKQATNVVEGWSDENGTTRYYEFNREKFAELIVEDVLDLCKKQKWHSGFNEYREGIRDTMKSIKEHFGVKP